jgi:hypothetical protein
MQVKDGWYYVETDLGFTWYFVMNPDVVVIQRYDLVKAWTDHAAMMDVVDFESRKPIYADLHSVPVDEFPDTAQKRIIKTIFKRDR